jgi:hypothetical protein
MRTFRWMAIVTGSRLTRESSTWHQAVWRDCYSARKADVLLVRFSSNQTLIGTPPSTWQNGSLAPIILPVRFTSTTTNATLTTSLPLSIHPYPFTSLLLPNSTATGNSSFSYDVTPYLVNQTVTLSVAYSPPEVGDWLSFDASTGVLSGEVPQVVDYRSAEVAVTATDPTSNLPGTSHLGILIVGAMVIPSTRTSSAASSPTSKYDAGAARLSKTSQIVIGTVIAGVFVLAVLVLLLACCCIRRHRRARAAAIAAANEKNEKPSGADGEGLTDVSLADPDPFRNYSTGSFGNPHDTATGGAFAALPQESPSKKKDKPRRLDMMRGLFGRGQSTTTLDPDGSGNSRPSSPANQLPKDLSGLPRSLVRSDSNDSFFSGDDHGQTLTPDGEPRVVGEDGSQRGAGITRDPLSAAGGLAAPLAAGVTALPFVGIRMLGSREPSLLGMAHSLNSSSPTFSTVEDGDAGSARRVGSGEGEGDVTSDEGSRASWESDSSFQWNSGDVRGSASNGDSLAGSGGMGSGSVRAAAGAAAVGAGMRLIRESSSRSLDGDSRRHHRQPSSASRLSSSGSDPNLARPRFFPPSSLSNTFTARSSDFADASEDASSSSPHPHPHQRGAPLPNSHSQPLTTSEDHSNESSDGFGSSSLEEGTSFGADSVMSPLARIGGDGAGLSSRDLGASTDGERGGTVDSMTPDSLLDDSLLDASAEPSSAPTPLPLIAALNHPRSRQKPQNLAPNDADPSPVSRNSSNASRASRPRPRLHPSSERVPVISHFPPPQSYHHLQPQPPQPLSARPQNPLPQSSRLSHSSPRSLQHASTSSPNSQSTYSPNPNLLSPNPNSNQASNNNPHFPMTSQYSDSFADADSDVDYHSSYPYPDPSSPSSAYSPNPNNDRRRSSFNRRSVQYAPSPANDLQNLGYPASSAIYFSEPPTDPQSPPHSSLPTSGSDPARGANPEETIRPVSYQSNAGGGGEGGAPTGWGGGGGGLPTLGRPMEDESDPFERR